MLEASVAASDEHRATSDEGLVEQVGGSGGSPYLKSEYSFAGHEAAGASGL